MSIQKKQVLYKKNERFAIKHIVTDCDGIDGTIRAIEEGKAFSDMELQQSEAVDIIDISYLLQDKKLHIMLHYAIIETDA